MNSTSLSFSEKLGRTWDSLQKSGAAASLGTGLSLLGIKAIAKPGAAGTAALIAIAESAGLVELWRAMYAVYPVKEKTVQDIRALREQIDTLQKEASKEDVKVESDNFGITEQSQQRAQRMLQRTYSLQAKLTPRVRIIRAGLAGAVGVTAGITAGAVMELVGSGAAMGTGVLAGTLGALAGHREEEKRAVLARGAAIAGLVGLSSLVHGTGWPLAATLAAVSCGTTYVVDRFVN